MDPYYLYSCEGVFLIHDYDFEKQALVLRKVDKKGCLDIIFFGVRYIEIPFYLEGVEIKVSHPLDFVDIYEKLDALSLEPNPIFAIHSKGSVYYISAFGFTVYKNDLQPHESILRTNKIGRIIYQH